MMKLVSLIKKTTEPNVYSRPAYIQLAAKRKCNRDDIYVVGVEHNELSKFTSSLMFHAISIEQPKEKGRAVVAIDSRTHANAAESADFVSTGATSESGANETPKDWFDTFNVTSRKDKNVSSTRSYQLQLSSSTTVGGSLNLNISGAGFFSAVAPTGGASASYSRTTGKSETQGSEETNSLAKGYTIEDTLLIPPKTKVNAIVTTWAVTHEAKVVTEITANANTKVEIRYRKWWSRKFFGGFFTSKVTVTAKELFKDEMDYECKDDIITFKRNGAMSYVGENVEVIKERKPCTLEEELGHVYAAC